jgi:hypothetical protein
MADSQSAVRPHHEAGKGVGNPADTPYRGRPAPPRSTAGTAIALVPTLTAMSLHKLLSLFALGLNLVLLGSALAPDRRSHRNYVFSPIWPRPPSCRA